MQINSIKLLNIYEIVHWFNCEHYDTASENFCEIMFCLWVLHSLLENSEVWQMVPVCRKQKAFQTVLDSHLCCHQILSQATNRKPKKLKSNSKDALFLCSTSSCRYNRFLHSVMRAYCISVLERADLFSNQSLLVSNFEPNFYCSFLYIPIMYCPMILHWNSSSRSCSLQSAHIHT